MATRLRKLTNRDLYFVTVAAPRTIAKPKRVIRLARTSRPGRIDKSVHEILLHVLRYSLNKGRALRIFARVGGVLRDERTICWAYRVDDILL